MQIHFGEEIPTRISEAFSNAEELELITVNPDWPTEDSLADPEAIHGFTVRERAIVSDRKQRLDLLAEFSRGALENENEFAACFSPRHVLRVEYQGAVHDLVICFECLTFRMYAGGESLGTGNISESPAPYFNRVFEEAGLSVAGRQP